MSTVTVVVRHDNPEIGEAVLVRVGDQNRQINPGGALALGLEPGQEIVLSRAPVAEGGPAGG